VSPNSNINQLALEAQFGDEKSESNLEKSEVTNISNKQPPPSSPVNGHMTNPTDLSEINQE